MDDYFEPSNLILARLELNFERAKSAQRWQRVKEYLPQIRDDYWPKNLKQAKQALQYPAMRGSKIYPYPKTWLSGPYKARFSAEISKDAQKPKKSQRAGRKSRLKSPFKSFLLT